MAAAFHGAVRARCLAHAACYSNNAFCGSLKQYWLHGKDRRMSLIPRAMAAISATIFIVALAVWILQEMAIV